MGGWQACVRVGSRNDLNANVPKKLGSTDPVLVHPDFQGLGLSRALIWSGWEKLKSRGIEVAELGTSSQNARGIAAFTKAGYRIDQTLAVVVASGILKYDRD